MTHHDEPGITVTGVGRATAAPDLMTVDLGISVLADSVADGRSRATELAQSLITAVKSHGVADEDIQTVRYTIQPEYDYHNGGQRLRGYRVSNDLTVTLRDLGAAGQVLDSAAGAGGDEVTINNVSFALEDEATTRDQARETAWADARSRADHLARLSGQELGPVSEILETSGRPPGPVPLARMAVAHDEATPIETGSTTITVTLQVRFGLGSAP